METQQFGLRLKELRSRSGLTQPALANAAGVSLSTIKQLEQGLKDPKPATAVKLAKALGVTTVAFEGPPAQQYSKRSAEMARFLRRPTRSGPR